MAGQPIKRQMLADIEKSGGFQNILDRVCSGESMTAIAKSFGVSRKLLVSTLYKDPKQKELLQGARKERGEAFAEQALEIIDNVEESPNAIAKAREQANLRKWLAGCDNPEMFGQKQATVQINVGDLHIDALRNAKPLDNDKLTKIPD